MTSRLSACIRWRICCISRQFSIACWRASNCWILNHAVTGALSPEEKHFATPSGIENPVSGLSVMSAVSVAAPGLSESCP